MQVEIHVGSRPPARCAGRHDSGTTTVPRRAADDKRLLAIHYRVLLTLGTVPAGSWCELSQTHLARGLGVCRNTVSVAIRRLVEWGYLERRGQAATRSAFCQFRLVLDGEADRSG